MLPDLAGKIAEPLQAIDKLTVVDTGHGEGAARVSNYVTQLMATAPEMLKNVSGIDVERMIRRFTDGASEAAAGSTGTRAAVAGAPAAAAPSAAPLSEPVQETGAGE